MLWRVGVTMKTKFAAPPNRGSQLQGSRDFTDWVTHYNYRGQDSSSRVTWILNKLNCGPISLLTFLPHSTWKLEWQCKAAVLCPPFVKPCLQAIKEAERHRTWTIILISGQAWSADGCWQQGPVFRSMVVDLHCMLHACLFFWLVYQSWFQQHFLTVCVCARFMR
jgi:hypothetical protein